LNVPDFKQSGHKGVRSAAQNSSRYCNTLSQEVVGGPRQKALRKARGTGLTGLEKQELRQRWDDWWSEVVVNIGYLPLTIHWYAPVGMLVRPALIICARSLEHGLFSNDVWFHSGPLGDV